MGDMAMDALVWPRKKRLGLVQLNLELLFIKEEVKADSL